MFRDCNSLVELNQRARELRAAKVDAYSINNAMNKRKAELISTAKQEVKSHVVYPPKDDIPSAPITSIEINIVDISQPFVVFKDGVLTI